MWKNPIFKIVLTTLILVGVFESISLLYIRISTPGSLSYKDKYLKFGTGEWATNSWNLRYMSHPYFGFVCDGFYIKEDCNNHNFGSKYNFPYKNTDDEIVVGVFGGSVAEGLGILLEDDEGFGEKYLKEKSEYFKNKKVKFINFSLGGYRQPQTFFVLSYYLETIDIAIFVDGANEMITIPYPAYPHDYPKLMARFFSDPEEDFWKKALIKSLRQSHNFIGRTISNHKILYKSSFLYLNWKFLNQLFGRWVIGLSDSMTSSYNKKPSSYNPIVISEDALDEKVVENWVKYTKLSQSIGKSQNKKVIHFLQPSHHIDGAKHLSMKEEKLLTKAGNRYDRYKIRLNKLRERAASLDKKELNLFDYTDLFSQFSETIFIDDFCHLNKKGEIQLIKSILDSIAKSFDAK